MLLFLNHAGSFGAVLCTPQMPTRISRHIARLTQEKGSCRSTAPAKTETADDRLHQSQQKQHAPGFMLQIKTDAAKKKADVAFSFAICYNFLLTSIWRGYDHADPQSQYV